MLSKFYKLFEGGNVFKGTDKQPLTTRISKGDIAPSLKMVEKILGFPLDQWLGSTGQKASSGDIDVSVDAAKHDKKDVANALKAWAKAQGQNPAEWVKLSGDNVHFKLPIMNTKGKATGEYAQLDLMFGNPQFQAWSMRGEPDPYSGMYRHVLLASIAKAQGMRWSYKNGLVDRATDKIISQDPKTIVQKLLPGYTGNPMTLNINDILNFIYKKYKNEPEKIEALIGEAVTTLNDVYGVMLPMPNQTTVHESNDTDEYFLAKLRDRIVNLGVEPLMEKTRLDEAKLRDINHLEDLILAEGPKGLERAISILRSFAEGKAHKATTIKWDGSPAIVFGRGENGQFILTDKSGWSAKGYDGKATSRKALEAMLANRPAPMDDARKAFIKQMGSIYDEYERATPKDFRGFFAGDLMYFNTPPVVDGRYVFKPNIVEYKVVTGSKIGQRIAQSKTGIVVHNYEGDQYSDVEQATQAIQGKEVFVIPPMYVAHPSKINTKPIDKLADYARKHAADLKGLFDPQKLKGIADIHALVYKYVNNKVDTGLEGLGKDFGEWLNTQKLTDSKKRNIANYLSENAKGMNALWAMITGVMKLKDYLIQEFDAHPSDVEQNIGGQPGGEGYVVSHPSGKVKLVKRGGFTAANRAARR